MRHYQAFLVERDHPEKLYGLMATDTLATLEHHRPLQGTTVVDVGGGPGFLADVLVEAGASCVTIDAAASELTLGDRTPVNPLLADGRQLPFPACCVDVVHSSNVLEHVEQPEHLLDELVRVVRPGGLVYVSFTPWWSPWGGHELSPWHYLGERFAVRRYEKSGRTIKNRPGSGLFRMTVAQVLRWTRDRSDVTVVSVRPRYYPSWTAPLVRLPIVREVLTWNVELVLRRRES